MSPRGRPAEPDGVVIIGGGVAGCSLAYRLSRQGLSPTLLERGRLGASGASAVAAALLNPYRGRSGKPGPFDLEGLEAFWRLTDELTVAGLEPGAHRTGVLRIASSARQARSWEALPGLRRLDEPPPGYRGHHGAFLVEAGGWLEPHRLVSALAIAATREGAELREECPVERLERRGESWLVHWTGGSLAARTVVLCLGAGEVAGIGLPPVERVAGDQVSLATDIALPYPLAGSVYLAGRAGTVHVGGNHRPAGTDDPRAPQLLKASASRLVPELAEAQIERVWTGVRAKRPDNVPLSAELEPGLWYLGAFGGRGFLTAPLFAERLATRLSERR